MTMTAVYTNFCGQIVNQVVGGVNRDIIPDPLGSTAHLVDDTQTKRASYTYTPYGEIESHSGETNPLNFVGTLGYYRDAVNSALTYIRARWYKAMYGRWMTGDLLWPEESSFTYCHSAPTTRIDSSGLIATVVSGAAIGTALCPGVGTLIGIGIGLIIIGGAVVVAEYCRPIDLAPPCPGPWPRNRCPEWLKQPLYLAYKKYCNKPRSCSGLKTPRDCSKITDRVVNATLCCAGRTLWDWCFPLNAPRGHDVKTARSCMIVIDCFRKYLGCIGLEPK